MATNNNEGAKFLLPYLQRADELQQHDPLVAYYCRMYAMERGLKIPKKERTNATTSLLVSLIKQLEKDRKSLKFSPDDHSHLEGFALNVFAKADKQYRAGRADMNTAKTFYAASIFFEILNHSGEITPDLEQKQKYAAWKAADIRKALKEGSRSLPAPPGKETDLSTPSRPSGRTDVKTRNAKNDINPSQEKPDPTTPLEFPKRQTSTKIRPPPLPFPDGDYHQDIAPSSINYSLEPQHNNINNNINNNNNDRSSENRINVDHCDSNYRPAAEKIAEAQKAARFAEGALASNEVNIAVEHLRIALEFLTNPSAGQ